MQVGRDEAICVHYVNIFEDGVIILKERQLLCMTCEYGRHHCRHVSSVSEYLTEDKHDLMPLLQSWMHTLRLSDEVPVFRKEQNVVSSCKIAFSCTFLHSSIMKMSPVNRFNILDGLCHLKPGLICSMLQVVKIQLHFLVKLTL